MSGRGLLRGLVARPQPRLSWRRMLVAGIGGFATIATLALLADATRLPLLAAVFGSSCVVVFTVPESPFSQPANVVAGHGVTTLVALTALTLLPVAWWSIALAVAVGVVAMAALRVTHPPAGGTAIAVMLGGATWWYLLVPILLGALVVVAVAMTVHRLNGVRYPAAA